jgi:RecA/RadA recombinase
VLPASTSHLRERIAALKLPGTIRFGGPPPEPVRRLSTGVAPVDALLGGGVPRGRICEVVGQLSSGRTALMHRLVARATRQDELAAIVDLPDAVDPTALETAGAKLEGILWIRPLTVQNSLKAAEMVLAAGSFGLVVLDLTLPRIPSLPLHVWPRLAAAARQSGTALVVLTPFALAGSFSKAVVDVSAQHSRRAQGEDA